LEPAARLVYGGDGRRHQRNGVEVVPWGATQEVEWA